MNSEFQGAVFDKANLIEVRFYECQFVSSKWRESRLSGCEFSSFYWTEKEDSKISAESWAWEDLLTSRFGPASFENSFWRASVMEACSFRDCSLVDNRMDRMKIVNSSFHYVDFSGTYIYGYSIFHDNQKYNVLGEPYEL